MVSYYSPVEEMYIFVGKDPIPSEKDGISIENLKKNRLHLRFRPGQETSPKAAAGGMNYPLSVAEPPQNKPLGGNFSSSQMSVDPTQSKGFMNSYMSAAPTHDIMKKNTSFSSQMSVDASNTDPNTLNFGGGMNPTLGGGSFQSTSAPPPAPVPQNPNPGSSVGGGMENDSNDMESNADGGHEIWSSNKANRRTKERKISFVIEKVSMWRKLYNGIQDNQGKIVRYR